MIGLVRIFFGAKDANPWLILVFLLLAGLFESLGLATLLPVLSLMSETGDSTSPLYLIVSRTLGTLGLPLTVGTLLSLGVAGIFLKGVFSMIAMSSVGYAGAAFATRMRTQLIKQLLDARWSYFTELAGGRISNAISVDATRANQTYIATAIMLKSAIETVVYAGVALLASWQLALGALVLGGLIAWSLQFLVRMARVAGRNQAQRTQQLVTYLNDILNNIKPLKAMAAQNLFTHLMQKRIAQVNRAMQKQVVAQFGLKYLEEFMVVAAIAAGFYIANRFWAIPIADFIAVGLIMFLSINAVGRFQRNYQKAIMLEAPVELLEELLAEAAAAREPNPGTAKPTLTQGCRFDGVVFSHGNKPVLDGVSLNIPAGSFTVITGPSGVGKSTLIDMLLGLYQADAGDITVDEVKLTDIDLDLWRGMVGYVPQELILLHDTILTNVTLGDPEIGEDEARAALRAAGAWDFVEAQPDGLLSPVGDKGTKLSGGQRQRIALARALVRKPKLLILDEVTSALDPETERDICDNIVGLRGDMTILAITHREAFTQIADQIYKIEDRRAHLVGGNAQVSRQAGA